MEISLQFRKDISSSCSFLSSFLLKTDDLSFMLLCVLFNSAFSLFVSSQEGQDVFEFMGFVLNSDAS